MNHYLLVYDRRKGKLLRTQKFTDGREAIRNRFAAERDHVGDKDIEVVVLGARSFDALRQTHARYFSSVKDLASSFGELAERALHS
ncbi:hypothetical protein [Herbidospora yilanensis]|uniref:hypothetical protein n=1 Tax=Herbidospora yilanensis TaxID=354426 RepID=UPI0007830F74|nr:hypothetical protein [Herbidospora yilanensis]